MFWQSPCLEIHSLFPSPAYSSSPNYMEGNYFRQGIEISSTCRVSDQELSSTCIYKYWTDEERQLLHKKKIMKREKSLHKDFYLLIAQCLCVQSAPTLAPAPRQQ